MARFYFDYRRASAGGDVARTDFVFVSQQTLGRGRRIGLLTSIGIALGLGVHIAYSVLGMAVLIASSAWLMTAVKIIGGAYLIYLGIQGLRARPRDAAALSAAPLAPQAASAALWKGFLCNVLNPKAPVYFVSLFTVVLSPEMPVWQLAAYGAWMMLLQLAWFAAVVWLLSVPRINRRFQTAGHWIDRILGAAMAGLGVKVMSN
nr:LysE family transporter [Conchiformibius kuhniae]